MSEEEKYIKWKRCKNCGRLWRMKDNEFPLPDERCPSCGRASMVYHSRKGVYTGKESIIYWCESKSNISVDDNTVSEVKT